MIKVIPNCGSGAEDGTDILAFQSAELLLRDAIYEHKEYHGSVFLNCLGEFTPCFRDPLNK